MCFSFIPFHKSWNFIQRILIREGKRAVSPSQGYDAKVDFCSAVGFIQKIE